MENIKNEAQQTKNSKKTTISARGCSLYDRQMKKHEENKRKMVSSKEEEGKKKKDEVQRRTNLASKSNDACDEELINLANKLGKNNENELLLNKYKKKEKKSNEIKDSCSTHLSNEVNLKSKLKNSSGNNETIKFQNTIKKQNFISPISNIKLQKKEKETSSKQRKPSLTNIKITHKQLEYPSLTKKKQTYNSLSNTKTINVKHTPSSRLNTKSSQNKKSDINKTRENVHLVTEDSSLISFQSPKEKIGLHISQPFEIHIENNEESQNLLNDLCRAFNEVIQNKNSIPNLSEQNSSITVDSSKLDSNENFKSSFYIRILDLFNKETLCSLKNDQNNLNYDDLTSGNNDILQKYNIGKETNSIHYCSTSNNYLNENANQKTENENRITRNDISIDDFINSNSSDVLLKSYNEPQIKDYNSSNKIENVNLINSNKLNYLNDKYDYSDSIDSSNILKDEILNKEKNEITSNDIFIYSTDDDIKVSPNFNIN